MTAIHCERFDNPIIPESYERGITCRDGQRRKNCKPVETKLTFETQKGNSQFGFSTLFYRDRWRAIRQEERLLSVYNTPSAHDHCFVWPQLHVRSAYDGLCDSLTVVRVFNLSRTVQPPTRFSRLIGGTRLTTEMHDSVRRFKKMLARSEAFSFHDLYR